MSVLAALTTTVPPSVKGRSNTTLLATFSHTVFSMKAGRTQQTDLKIPTSCKRRVAWLKLRSRAKAKAPTGLHQYALYWQLHRLSNTCSTRDTTTQGRIQSSRQNNSWSPFRKLPTNKSNFLVKIRYFRLLGSHFRYLKIKYFKRLWNRQLSLESHGKSYCGFRPPGCYSGTAWCFTSFPSHQQADRLLARHLRHFSPDCTQHFQ